MKSIKMEELIMKRELSMHEKKEISEKMDAIENAYKGRNCTISDLGREFKIPKSIIQKTLKNSNYCHGIKRTKENRLNNKLINGVITPEKNTFLLKYKIKKDK